MPDEHEQGGTRVVRVDVTAEDIREGRRNCGSSCPIHRVEQRLRRIGQYAQEDAQTQRALAFEHARHLVLTAGGRGGCVVPAVPAQPAPTASAFGDSAPQGQEQPSESVPESVREILDTIAKWLDVTPRLTAAGLSAVADDAIAWDRAGRPGLDTPTQPAPVEAGERGPREPGVCPFCGDDLADPEYARRIFAHEADTAGRNAANARDSHLRRCRTQRWWEVFVRLVAKYPEEGVAARFADRIVDGGADHLRGGGRSHGE